MSELKSWLDQQPLSHEIKQNEDGSSYIPVEFIKPKLFYLSPFWGTRNFTHYVFEMPVFDRAGNKIGTTMWVSGNVELVIEYEGQTRCLSGSATFDTARYYPNKNWGQICLSLCIVAAAKELGNFFGKQLNKDDLTMPTEQKLPIKKRGIDKAKNTINKIHVKGSQPVKN